MITVHSAVRFVQESEELWENDKVIANKRAMIIVCHLIDSGFLDGVVDAKYRTPIEKPNPGITGFK